MKSALRSGGLILRDLLLLSFDMVLRRLAVAPKSSDGDLVIVRMDGIGDFILWFDAFKALREHHSDRRITLICNQAWQDLARQVPGFDEIIPIDVRRLRVDLGYRYRTFSDLAKRRFETVINPLYSRQGFSDAEALGRVLKAREKIGSSGDPSIGWRSRLGSWWFDHLIPARDEPLMELVRNAEFVRGLGIKDFRAGLPELPLELPADPELPSKGYYLLFPGGSDPIRLWPAGSFAEIGRRLHEQTGMIGVVCGAPADRESASEIIARSGVPMVDRAGRTTLPELAALIKHSRLVISNETGAVHMATALAVPSICLLGGGHFGRFMPYVVERDCVGPASGPVFHRMDCYGCNWHCPFPHGPGKPAPCVANIGVGEVFEKIDAILQPDPKITHISSSRA